LLLRIEFVRADGLGRNGQGIFLEVGDQLDVALHARRQFLSLAVERHGEPNAERAGGEGDRVDLLDDAGEVHLRVAGRLDDPLLAGADVEQLFLGDARPNEHRARLDDGHQHAVRRERAAGLQRFGHQTGAAECAARELAVVDHAVDRGLDDHRLAVRQQLVQLLLGLLLLDLRLFERELRLLQRDGQGFLGLVPLQFQASRGLLDVLFLSREPHLDRFVVAHVAHLDGKLGLFEVVAGPLQDDLFGFLGQVVGLIHLFELPDFFLLVFKVVLGAFQSEVGRLLLHGGLDVEISLQILRRVFLAAGRQLQIQRREVLQQRDLLLGKPHIEVGQLQRCPAIGDLAVDLLHVERHQQLSLLYPLAVLHRLEHLEGGPLLRVEDDFFLMLGFEDAFEGDLDLERPFLDLVRRGLLRIVRLLLLRFFLLLALLVFRRLFGALGRLGRGILGVLGLLLVRRFRTVVRLGRLRFVLLLGVLGLALLGGRLCLLGFLRLGDRGTDCEGNRDQDKDGQA